MFRVILGYIISWKPAWTVRPPPTNKTNKSNPQGEKAYFPSVQGQAEDRRLKLRDQG